VPGIGAVENGDIIRWNGTSASLFLDGDSFFGIDVNIDAFDVTAEGNWAFSLENDASIPTFGGLSVENGDVVLWDINANTATIWLDESVLANGPADIDALAVPEPNTAALFALGLLGLGLTGRRRPPR
jgi:hypothetical protein